LNGTPRAAHRAAIDAVAGSRPAATAHPETDARLRSRETETTAPKAVSPRAIVIGLLCAAFFCAITPYNDFKIAATYIAGTQFPIGAVFIVFLLSFLVNGILHSIAPRKVFSRGELLTIWTLILVASGLPSSGMMRYFIPHIVALKYMSNGSNGWEDKIWRDMPEWLKFHDQAAADAFFKGYPLGQEHVPWGAWVGPLAAWVPLALLFLLATFCLAAILRRQWVENEKFSFPLVTLPVLLADEPRPGHRVNDLLRHPLLWLGVGLSTVVHTVRGLHLLYPSIPDIQMTWSLNDYLTVRPWDQLGWMPLNIYLLVIGIAYLLPAEVCFSLWFFFWFVKGERLLGVQYNWLMPGPRGYGDVQFHSLQAYGGGIALILWTLWTGRRHFADVWEKATGGPRAGQIDDASELISYRGALTGLAVAYGGILLWMTLAQVPLFMSILTLLTMTLALVVISWVVCQAGMLFMAQPYTSLDVLTGVFGTAPFKIPAMFTITRFESMLFLDTREMLAPSILMGAKTADTGHFNARALLKAMTASVLVGFVVSLVASIYLPYYNGGGNSLQNEFTYHWAPQGPLDFLGGVASIPFRGSWTNSLHMLAGLAGVLGLLILRARFNVGIHPIGFLSASVYAMTMLWPSIFLGWLCKTLVSRYGGMKGYLGFMPVFLGLILGDVINAVIWIILGYATQVGYQIMPG
jgi:hypothetical protein